MKRLLIVDTAQRLLYPSILTLSLYFLFSGHNQPGGGFVGGLTAGAAVSLRYVSNGVEGVREALRVKPWVILGTGLLTAFVTALVPIMLGESVLEHDAVSVHIPLVGTVKSTTALPFDAGVYLVVLGVVLIAFEAFGDDEHDDEDERTMAT